MLQIYEGLRKRNEVLMGKGLDPDIPKRGAELASEFEYLDQVSSPNADAVAIRADEAGSRAVP
ncbi:hypothetical protein ACNFIA_16725 [Pseudomonas sp. NY15437]|uniref:hypothetical protein n=1 Tax=Pseudomonas sp. NY15437 TaxID=3400360 RepID=UPI003A8A8195